MAKLVLLLSLLSAILGLVSSETEDLGECGFSFLYHQPSPDVLIREVKDPELDGRVLMDFRHEYDLKGLGEFPIIDLDCDEATKSKILFCNLSSHVVVLDLFLGDGKVKARVSCSNDSKLNHLDYIVQQSGPVVYDVFQFGDRHDTAIIPSNLLTNKSLTVDEGSSGYWSGNEITVVVQFKGADSSSESSIDLSHKPNSIQLKSKRSPAKRRKPTVKQMKFELKQVTRTRTTIAFLYSSGLIRTFPVTSVDTTAKCLKCENMHHAVFAIILSERDVLDTRVFQKEVERSIGFSSWASLFFAKDQRATYDNPNLWSSIGKTPDYAFEFSPRHLHYHFNHEGVSQLSSHFS